MGKKIEVWLDEASEPIVHVADNAYTKGPLYCVKDGERVFKYPLCRVFRVVEEYGTHGGKG